MKNALFVILNILIACVTFTLTGLYRLVMFIAGLFLQPLAIQFAKEDRRSMKPYTQYPEHGCWYLRTAPKWLFPFGNERDGFLGDKRGWWANEVVGDEESFKSQYLWSAIRNPCNNMRFMPLSSVDVSKAKIDLIAGDEYVKDKIGSEGWQFVRAIDERGIPYYGFYFVKRRGDTEKGIVIRIGFKVEPRHTTEYAGAQEEQYGSQYKGMTFRVSLSKDIS